MRHIDKRPNVSRRTFIKAGGASLIAMQIVPGGLITGKAWAATPQALKAESYATLVQMSRDLYPHDRLADSYYAAAVDGLDQAAATDAALRDMLEAGVAEFDTAAQTAHSVNYIDLPWERDRTALLKAGELSPFVQKVRGNLVTGLYNNKELWPLFGYEGESASQGGYINRGFNDLDWL